MIARVSIAATVLFSACLAHAGKPAQERIERESDVVRAVALVRHFHPHDAAEAVDWNAVLLRGFELASSEATHQAFAAGLAELLAPLGAGITRGVDAAYRLDCEPDQAVRWAHIGFDADWANSRGVYASLRANLPVESLGEAAHSEAVKSMPADDWQGKSLRFSAGLRAPGGGQSTLWVRLLDADEKVMQSWERTTDATEWTRLAISFEVPDDARQIAVGLRADVGVAAEFRAQKLEIRSGEGAWRPTEPAPAGSGAWRSDSPRDLHTMTTRAGDSHVVTRLDPFDPAEYLPADAPISWRLELVDGSFLRIPLALCPGDNLLADDVREELAMHFGKTDMDDLSTAELARLDVATLWPPLHHFYPYRSVMDEWPDKLREALGLAAGAETRQDLRAVLQSVTVPLHDGHVWIRDRRGGTDRAWLPLAIERVDGRLVVSASDVEDIEPGDLLAAIDGIPAEEWWAQRHGTHSGSPHWREYRMRLDIANGEKGRQRNLILTRDGEELRRIVTYELSRPLDPVDYPPVRQPVDNVYHVDLTAIDGEELDALIPKLAEARGVIFDVRGYPMQSFDWIGHLLDGDERWRDWMHVMVARAPGGDLVTGTRNGWRVAPADPRIDAPVIFLTDESAISYAESILALVKRHDLGILVGGPTAGANGNINTLRLPSGFTVTHTGMRVIGPGGKPIHGSGIQPDIRVQPNLEAIRAGRDLVFERALSEIDQEH